MDFEPFPVDTDAPEVKEESKNVNVEEFLHSDVESCVYHAPLPTSEYIPDMRDLPAWTKKKRHAQSFAEGKLAEAEFVGLASRFGYEVIEPTQADDFYNRIDVVLKNHTGTTLIDIKAMRRTTRSAEIQCEYTWLELHKQGSLFSGKSQVLALQIVDGWILLDKAKLREWVQCSFQPTQRRVERANQALMRPYRRKGRFPEWISMVRIRDLSSAALLAVWRSKPTC